MTLGHFIQQHHSEIIGEFSAFARTLVPQDSQMTDADLRDHAAMPQQFWFESSGDLLGEWDSDRLAQLVSNLVGNAIQHGEGSPVTLTALEVGDQAVVSVHNSGSPIARPAGDF